MTQCEKHWAWVIITNWINVRRLLVPGRTIATLFVCFLWYQSLGCVCVKKKKIRRRGWTVMLLTDYVVNCLKPVIWKQTSKSKLYIFKVTFSTRFLLIPRFKFIKYHREREGRKEMVFGWGPKATHRTECPFSTEVRAPAFHTQTHSSVNSGFFLKFFFNLLIH